MNTAGLIIIAAVLIASFTVAGWWLARRAHVRRLTAAATTVPAEFLGDSELITFSERDISRPVGPVPDDAGSAAGQAALATAVAVPAQVLFHLSQLDPSVLEGIHLSGAAAVSGPYDYWGMLDYAAANVSKLDSVGFTSRLQGYVGEARAQEILAAQGYSVSGAQTPNNPGFDLTVDGLYNGFETVDVKVADDMAMVNASAADRPDIAHFVNGDVQGSSDLPNVFVEQALNRSDIQDSLASTLDSAASLAEGDIGLGVDPISAAISVGLIAHAQFRAVRRGDKLVEAAIVDGAWAAAGRVPGMLLGAKGGAELGATIGAMFDAGTGFASLGSGTFIGGFTGGAVGAMAGSEIGNRTVVYVRDRPIRENGRALDAALASYGASCREAGALNQLESLIGGPYDRARNVRNTLRAEETIIRQSWRWMVWPTPAQVLVVESSRLADREVEQAREVYDSVAADLAVLRDSPEPDIAVGLLLANNPVLRTLTHTETPELTEVRYRYARHVRLRHQRAHPLTSNRLVRAWRRARTSGEPRPEPA